MQPFPFSRFLRLQIEKGFERLDEIENISRLGFLRVPEQPDLPTLPFFLPSAVPQRCVSVFFGGLFDFFWFK